MAAEPIGRVYFDDPRAVRIREPQNVGSHHSAVRGSINIVTLTKTEADEIIKNWPEFMKAISFVVDLVVKDKERIRDHLITILQTVGELEGQSDDVADAILEQLFSPKGVGDTTNGT